MVKTNPALTARLRLLRVMAGETQEQTAGRMNISRSCLANYETGRRIPDYNTLVLFAEHFRVNVSYLTEQVPIGAEETAEQETELMQLVSESGMIDLSEVSAEGQIALLQFYRFLQELQGR